MNISKRIAIAVTSSLLAASSFAADGVKVALRLENNGKLLATPVLVTKFGERASVQMGGDGTGFRIELLAQDAGAAADIAFKLYLDEGNGMTLVSEPRIVSGFDTKSVVSETSKSGTGVRLSIEASRADIPAAK